jgi:hypothetical protein
MFNIFGRNRNYNPYESPFKKQDTYTFKTTETNVWESLFDSTDRVPYPATAGMELRTSEGTYKGKLSDKMMKNIFDLNAGHWDDGVYNIDKSFLLHLDNREISIYVEKGDYFKTPSKS